MLYAFFMGNKSIDIREWIGYGNNGNGDYYAGITCSFSNAILIRMENYIATINMLSI